MLRSSLILLGFLLLSAAGFPDGRPRKREGLHANLRSVALLQHDWAAEPESPPAIDRVMFARALSKLCPALTSERAENYAALIEDSARGQGEDPFLLAALVHRMSNCRADFSNAQGQGLTGLDLEMLRDNLQGRTLRYLVSQASDMVERQKTLSRALTVDSALDAQTNLEWAAALLAMWREQHAALDQHFEQIPHRHHVSHFIWGDKIPSDREEDRVFTDRRRLLENYGIKQAEHTVAFRNILWGSPLEASPRVVSSAPGAARDAGLRRHKGVDVESVQGEPVLAMADGVVFFAGVDMPGQGARPLDPKQVKRVSRRRMGRGGRFVCIDHGPNGPAQDEAFLQSCYMHLEDVHVTSGEVVKRGQPIGTVGRTGCKHSPPHLHLEIKSDKRRYDARDVVPGILIGEPPHEQWKKRKKVPRV
jgi:murein DD-endopeptidase MepM/ murein hydrolase activator NlpD